MLIGHYSPSSMSQLERFGQAFVNMSQRVGIQINPGFSKTNVGGPSFLFGIWHELVTDGTVPSIVDKYGLVNPGEKTTDLGEISAPIADAFRDIAVEHRWELRLEIEPGAYLVANAGALVTTILDKVSTKLPLSDEGHVFLKMDAGMTDVLYPSLYGAIHPIMILPASGKSSDISMSTDSVVVIGHCGKSGNLMTPKPGQPESLEECTLRTSEIGDIAVMDGSSAYCSGMSLKNYNSFPEAPEVLVDMEGGVHLIRKRQTLHLIYQNECNCNVPGPRLNR
ncbi:hypothetical protein ACHAW5_005538 [Stephanodiscus triporus]|uniref:Orn/DAP/Arg decarboxylase 2 C-terminal domain-containing protein n=1 Tax=Stephanodiscus triporus TaxID=2934178 RepID=A0ABD3MYL2_9STRA